LCSSFEAFHHTRENRGDARDVDDEGIEREVKRVQANREKAIVPVSWYEEQIGKLIPSKAAPEKERFLHPKMVAVVNRSVKLWLSGEKVLIFCFYRETAKALRVHIGREIELATLKLAAEKLGINSGEYGDRIRTWFERVTRRLTDENSPFHREIIATLRKPLESEEFHSLHSRMGDLVNLLAAYVRSPSFIARYFPLELPEVREALLEGSTRAQVVRAGATALSRALEEAMDSSAMTMQRRVQEFLRFAKELGERAQRSAPSEKERRDPLQEYIDAIAVYVSPRKKGEKDEEDDMIPEAGSGSYRALQPVRMVYGDTSRDIRNRIMLAFNSPMFPEVLISSAVLGEGVDLHRFCRHVIHHDLCWNPSTLEQRTGRLDRIRCKAELTHRPIVVYEPFIGGSADEKMFRVVRDRERWFQIVMGQKFEFDEATSEQLANRVPLPEDLANSLVFNLRRFSKGPNP